MGSPVAKFCDNVVPDVSYAAASLLNQLLALAGSRAARRCACRKTIVPAKEDDSAFLRAHQMIFRRWLSADLEARHAELRAYSRETQGVSLFSLLDSARPDSISLAEQMLFQADVQLLHTLGGVDTLIPYDGIPAGDWRLAEVVTSIGKLYGTPHLTLGGVGARLRLSGRYLGKLFYRHAGVSFHKYVRAFRIAKAADSLCTSQGPIKEAAACCGYSSPNNFIRDFTFETGLSPSQYRQHRRSIAVALTSS